jgi:hypothetical protein
MGREVANESPTSYFGPRQFYVPKRIVPIVFTGAAEKAGGTAQFRVDVPDSRVRVKLSVLCVPPYGGALDFASTYGMTLWLGAVDDDSSGANAGVGIPITNVMDPIGGVPVTQAAPAPFPADGLSGYSREFVTAADGIEGIIVVPPVPVAPIVGVVSVQARFQPDPQRLPWAEWDEIRRECRLRVISSVRQ